MRIQAQGRGVALGPACEAALRKSLLADPEALPVVGQNLDGVATARAEDEKRSAERIAREGLTAEGSQTVYAFAKIHGLDRYQDPHVWGDLDHGR